MSYYGSGGDNRYGDKSSYRDGPPSSFGKRDDIGAQLKSIHWDLSKLPVFEKNFYIEHPDVRKRSEEDAQVWRRSVDITVVGKGIPKPVLTFEEASMPGMRNLCLSV